MNKRSIFTLGYTREDVQEQIRCAQDPMYFIRKFVKIQHPINGTIPFDLTSEQERWVKAYTDHNHVIASLPRQVGKTTVGSAFILWYALYHNECTIVMCSSTHDQAKEMLSKIRFMYANLPVYLRAQVRKNTKTELQFEHGTRILTRAVTPHAVRGLTFSLLYLDDFAFVNPDLQIEFYEAAFPSIIMGAKCMMVSTPSEGPTFFNASWSTAVCEVGTFYPVKSED